MSCQKFSTYYIRSVEKTSLNGTNNYHSSQMNPVELSDLVHKILSQLQECKIAISAVRPNGITQNKVT